jgi:quinol-cytochrome oxidoreductase complex cytochrome b subunit
LYAFFWFFLVFAGFVLYYPNLLGDPNNYILADSIHTPRHIVPEWYFLPFYAMLRSIPHKVAGILTMLFSLLVLFLLPFLDTSLVKGSSRMFFRICYFAMIADFLVLGWLGQSPVDEGSMLVGQIATVYYFVFFLILLPFSGHIETLMAFSVRRKPERWTLQSIVNVLYPSLRILYTLLILIVTGSLEIDLQ